MLSSDSASPNFRPRSDRATSELLGLTGLVCFTVVLEPKPKHYMHRLAVIDEEIHNIRGIIILKDEGINIPLMLSK